MRYPSLILVLVALAATARAGPSNPEPLADAPWIRACGRQRQALQRENIDLCFVGDSLTEFWTATGKPVWDLQFHDRACVNLGLAGDRTEHILHRIQHLDFSRARPKTFILLAGTNNLSRDTPDSPEAVATAITRIADLLRTKSPGARVIILAILPNGHTPDTAIRKSILETNRRLSDHYAKREDPSVIWLDLHDRFLTEKGTWKPNLTLDGTHLSQTGYDTLAQALLPHLE